MVIGENTSIESLVLHKVGNKSQEEGTYFSNAPFKISESIHPLLLKYFLSPFKQTEYFTFFHEEDINENIVYSSISAIFDDSENLFEQSLIIAKHLYEQSTHPKVKGGELYVALLNDCQLEGEFVDAIGIFKSESKETFLKIQPSKDNFSIESEDGVNISKLDKGCIIFNIEKEKGYKVMVIDNQNKGTEAQYWRDNFLKIKQREDNFYHTQNVIKMVHDFVVEKMPEQFEVSKADQLDIMNKSKKYFKDNEDFKIESFANEVITQPELISSFNKYKTEYETREDINISDDFALSDEAIKKESRIFKSKIKLDKNFHIYVHGSRQYITKGFDEKTGLNFYQLFFKEEE